MLEPDSLIRLLTQGATFEIEEGLPYGTQLKAIGVHEDHYYVDFEHPSWAYVAPGDAPPGVDIRVAEYANDPRFDAGTLN